MITHGLIYPSCPQCHRGSLFEVDNKTVDVDDLPESMRNRRWTFTGLECEHCGAMVRGRYNEKND